MANGDVGIHRRYYFKVDLLSSVLSVLFLMIIITLNLSLGTYIST